MCSRCRGSCRMQHCCGPADPEKLLSFIATPPPISPSTTTTTEPWSAVRRIADPQPSRAPFLRELCPLVPLITAAVPSRAIPCSAVPQQRHKIVQNRLALVGEESVSGVTAEPPPGQAGTPTHAHLHHRQ